MTLREESSPPGRVGADGTQEGSVSNGGQGRLRSGEKAGGQKAE